MRGIPITIPAHMRHSPSRQEVTAVFKAIIGFFRRSGSGMAAAGKRAAQASAVKAAGTHAPGAQAEVTENARDVEKALFFKSFPRPKIIALRASEVDHDAA